MLTWWGERLLVLQSVGAGIQLVPASREVDTYDGGVEWWSLKPELAPKLDRKLLLETAISLLGEAYATDGVLRLIWRMLLNRYHGGRDPKGHPQAAFCSQYVSYCYRTAGVDPRPDEADACTSPGDFARSPKLERRAVLKA
jgi:hypothetical protein